MSEEAGDQLSNPLVDFVIPVAHCGNGWGSTLKPSGRLHDWPVYAELPLGINSQTLW